MAVDLRCAGAAFDSHEDSPGQDRSPTIYSASRFDHGRFEESSQMVASLSAPVWMPMEKWLVESQRDGPFCAIVNVDVPESDGMRNGYGL